MYSRSMLGQDRTKSACGLHSRSGNATIFLAAEKGTKVNLCPIIENQYLAAFSYILHSDHPAAVLYNDGQTPVAKRQFITFGYAFLRKEFRAGCGTAESLFL